MENKKVTTLQVAGTYIGTIVGAGFASGQEMLQFFVRFGKMGFWGIIVVTLLFMWFGYLIMNLGCQLNVSSHLPIVMKAGGRIFGTFSDIVITFFLFGALTAMIAGSGALFYQEFNIHPLIGSLFMAVITIITVVGGFYNIINSISIVVPFLILSAIGVSVAAILSSPTTNTSLVLIPESKLIRNWLWSGIIYTSYNTVTSIAILGPLGARARDKKVIRNGAILGGLGLGVGAIAIFMALYVNVGSIKDLEVPMIMVARQISPAVQIIYAIVLLAEIYTTAVGDLFGFTARLCDMNSKKAYPVIFISTAAAFLASLAGFSNLVKYLYPAVGYCGVITLMCLIYNRYKT